MDQPLNPVSFPPQSFEGRLSRVRAWTLIPVVLGPTLAWGFIQHGRGVSDYVSHQVTSAILNAALLGWWLAVAPRPYSHSVRATMGQPLNFAGCKLVMVAALGASCLGFMEAVKIWDLLREASSGGVYTIGLTGLDPANWVALLFAVVVAPLLEELVFRGVLFRGWRVRWSPVVALLVSSAAFGACHKLALGSFLSGVTYALLYTRTRSLWANLLAHSLHNGVVAAMGGLHYFWSSPRLVLDGPVAYGTFVLALLIGTGVWLHFVIESWRTLGAPLSPDSLPAASAASPAAPAEALGGGSQLR